MEFKVLVSIIFITTLVGCAPNLSTTQAKPTDIQPTSTTPTPASSSASEIMPTASIQTSENWEKSKNCVKVYSSRPEAYQLAGVVAARSLSTKILGLELSLLGLASGDMTVFPTPTPVDDASVSSDRKALGYVHFNTSSLKWELTIVDVLGEIQKTAWSSDENFGFDGWLNDHQVVIFQDSKFIIVDIVQDSQSSFSPSDFPDLSYPFLALDSSMTRAIYKSSYKSSEINLFDLRTKIILAQIEDSYDRAPIIAWQSSGERAAIVAPAYNTPPGSPDEIFIIEHDGQSKQLTHLYDIFGETGNIGSLSWSPDGEEIAFWLPDNKGNDTLMVADAITGDVTNYCILNNFLNRFPIYVPAPIWSPDGKQLLVENRYTTDESNLLVVDPAHKVAFPIAKNENPIGWMLTP